MAILVKKKSFSICLVSAIFILIFNSSLGAQESEPLKESSSPQEDTTLSKGKKKVTKKLPKKSQWPDGYLPLDPTMVAFVDGVPQIEGGAPEKINMALPTSDFEGVVQFVSGDVTWEDEKKTPDPLFKSIIRRGDKLVLSKGSYIKVITQKRCIAVAFGPGTLDAPKSHEVSIWESNGTSLRWNCPSGQEEKIVIDDKPLTLFGGELFYHSAKLLMRAGEAQAQSGRLEATNLYNGKENFWVIAKNQPSPFDLYKFNQELPQPIESLKQEEPAKPARYRLSLTPMAGEGNIEHNTAQIRETASEGIEGGRIQVYFHTKKSTYFFAISEYGQSDNQNYSCGPGCNPGNYAELEVFMLSFGQRFQRERSWSYFYRVGLGDVSLQYNIRNTVSGCGTNCYIQDRVKYDALTLGLGVDKIFNFYERKTLSWLGFMISAEFQYLTNGSEGRSKENHTSQAVERDVIRQSGLHSMSMIFSLGPLFYF